MFSRCLDSLRCAVALATLAGTGVAVSAPVQARADEPVRVLRVAADPNNLPFSNDRREGFENKIVELIASDLNAKVEYTWWAQRRGFVRNTIKAGQADLVAGIPRDSEMTLNTAPYYRSTYVIATRRDHGPRVTSLDDPALKTLRIGVPLVGGAANPPPAEALGARGLANNLRGYTVYGDYTQPNPPTGLLDALLRGDVDVAVVWGPLAGFFAKQHHDALDLSPLPPRDAVSTLPFAFDISMGVKRGNRALRDEIDAVLKRRKPEIDAILASYGVPRLDAAN